MQRWALLFSLAGVLAGREARGDTLGSAYSAAREAFNSVRQAIPSNPPPPPAFTSSSAENSADQGQRDAQQTLINGQPVPAGSFTEVVSIRTGGAGCTATVIGPRVILTAAHCGRTGATSKFTIAGAIYEAKLTRSSLYLRKDHDIALGVTTVTIQGIQPASVGGSASVGDKITLLGYGCTQPGGGGGNDGVLRMGETKITGFSGFDMVSSMEGGGALCFGDSGGPAFIEQNGKRLLLGVNSKGNIKDTNYNARLDAPESQDFLKDFAQRKRVEICGVNLAC